MGHSQYEMLRMIGQVPDEDKKTELLSKLNDELKFNSIDFYRPYGHPDTLMSGELWQTKNKLGQFEKWSEKPWQTDFHNAGSENKERMLICANGVGKSISGAYETAIHLTGNYPDWWEGYRYTKAPKIWIGSITNEVQRDHIQPLLLGGDLQKNLGTGFVPKKLIYGRPTTRQCGISGTCDTFRVRHASGGTSIGQFKTYEQGWRKWQASAPDGVWLDEEPNEHVSDQRDIFTEVQTRLVRTTGFLWVTFTPLLGMTQLTRHFLNPQAKGIIAITATWDDAPHLNKENKDRLIATYPSHQVEARTKGVPMMGEGAVFVMPEKEVVVSPFQIPDHFHQIKGIDFGLDHPAGVVDLAIDPEKGIIYVTRSWKKKINSAIEHVEAINRTSPWVPVAWPHDGGNREKGSGKELKGFYTGCRLLGRSARYTNDKGGSQKVWPVIREVIEREENGGIKYFSTCTDLLEERRNYHTVDGKLVAHRDDALKSMFYAVMMRRFARMNIQRSTNNVVPMAFSTR